MVQIKKEKDDSYRFFLTTENGRTLLTSVQFAEKEEVEKAIGKLGAFGKYQYVFERRTNHEGQFLFILKDMDGNLIAKSDLYNSEAGMENGIKNLKTQMEKLSDLQGL